MLTGKQCKAARALLGWKQSDLSAAIRANGGRFSVAAITAFERGGSIRESNSKAVVSALEGAGVQFLAGGETAMGLGVALNCKN